MPNHKSIPLSLLIVSLAAGFLLIGHFRTYQFARPDDTVGKLRDQERIAEQLVIEQTTLKNKIKLLREEIEILSAETTTGTASTELDDLYTQIGLSPAEGRGVVITLSTPSSEDGIFSSDELALYAANLRDITQRLWSAGATSISINGQRVIALSPITFVGNSILINDSRSVPPFEIVALGDPDILAQEMDLDRYLPSLARQVASNSFSLQIKPSQNLTTPVFSGRLSTTYLSPAND